MNHLLLCAAALLRAADSAPLPPVVGSRGLWVWGGAGSPLKNASASADFFAWAAAQSTAPSAAPISTALVEDEGLTAASTASANSSAFAALVTAAAAATPPMQIAALYGWSGSGGKQGPLPAAGVLSFLDRLLALAPALPAQGLAGISLDLEPNEAAVPGSHQAYADLLPLLRARLDAHNGKNGHNAGSSGGAAPNLTLSIAGSWGYASQNVSCAAYGGGNASMLQCAVAYVDTFVLMNYRNSAYGCYCRPPGAGGANPPALRCPADGGPVPGNCSDDGSSAGARDGMLAKAVLSAQAVRASPYRKGRLALGVEASCFAASDVADLRYEYKLSFCRTGPGGGYMARQMALTAAGLAAAGLWRGVVDEATPWVVESYRTLVELEES
jgi:hypothetical protein